MISNRQSSSRRRGRGGSSRSSGGGGSQGQRDSGNRIDSRTRGNAAQLLEKYRNMARDAQMSGDRVNTEYYLQFADHYFRVLSDSRARQDDHRPVRPVDDFDAMDEEYGDEGEPIRAGEQGGYDAARSNGSDNRSDRSDGNRQDGNRSDGNRQSGRDYQGRDDRQPREERSSRDDRSRDERSRDDRSRRDSRDRNQQNVQRDHQPRAEQPRQPEPSEQPVEAQASMNGAAHASGPANDVEAAPVAAKPERKPRTSRSRSAAPAPAPEMEVASMDADRLPPSLGIVGEAVAASESEAEPKPKRRRSSRSTAPEPEAQAS